MAQTHLQKFRHLAQTHLQTQVLHKYGLGHLRMMHQDDATHVQHPCAEENMLLMGQADAVMPWHSKYHRQACRMTSKIALAYDPAAISLQERVGKMENRAFHVLNFRLRHKYPPGGKTHFMSDCLKTSSFGSCLDHCTWSILVLLIPSSLLWQSRLPHRLGNELETVGAHWLDSWHAPALR